METIKPAPDGKIQWNDRPIVWVDGTVMERREDGWIPHLGNGHSKVAIYESSVGTHYKLYAYRAQDKVVTLDSLIPVRMPFFRGNEIFQHWQIGENRLGLAFNGTADARSFDRGIRVALENLEKARQLQLQQRNNAATTNSSVGSSSSGQVSDGSLTSDSPVSLTAPPMTSLIGSSRQQQSRQHRSSQQQTGSGLGLTSCANPAASSPNNKSPASFFHATGNSPSMTSSSMFRSSALASSPPPPPSTTTTTAHHHPQQSRNETMVTSHHDPNDVLDVDAERNRLTTRHHSSSVVVPGHACRVAMTSQSSPPTLHQQQIPSTAFLLSPITNNSPDELLQDASSSSRSKHQQKLNTKVSTSNETHHGSSRHHRSTQSSRRSHHHHRTSGSTSGNNNRIRMNKPPTLSKLDQKRDMQPTKYNSYVQINDKLSSTQHNHHHRDVVSGGRSFHHMQPIVMQQPSSGGMVINQYQADYRGFYLGKTSGDPVAADPMLISGSKKQQGGGGRGTTAASGSKSSSKRDLGERLRCRHCQSYYNQARNPPGSCRDAPADMWQRCFRYISCLICANAILYHGCRDEEGNYPRYATSSCMAGAAGHQEDSRNRGGGNRRPRYRYWLTLLLLSFVLPCLCLYPLLAACHRCAVTCRCCGGRHEAPLPQHHSSPTGSRGRGKVDEKTTDDDR